MTGGEYIDVCGRMKGNILKGLWRGLIPGVLNSGFAIS
jgi:hypothetical protein